MLGRFQRLGPWLFWLFLSAQIGGVMPLLYTDEVHEYGQFDVISALAIPAPYNGSREHQPGTHDEHDQCCTMHHGTVGTLPDGFYQAAVPIVHLVFEITRVEPATKHPIRIDHPPKA